MANKIALQTQAATWFPENGKFNAMTRPFQRGQSGITGATIAGKQGTPTPFFGTDEFGRFIQLGSEPSAPGQSGITIQNYLTMSRDAVQAAALKGECPYIQVRINDGCTSMDSSVGWRILIHYGKISFGDISFNDLVARAAAGARLEQDIPATADLAFIWFWQSLGAQTTTEANAANGIAFLTDPEGCGSCGNGYPGPEKVGYIGHDAGSGVSAKVTYTQDGSAWSTTTADPFGNDEHIGKPVIISGMGGVSSYRVIVPRGVTDGSNPAEIAYGSASYGSGDISSWTNVNIGSTNGEFVTAMYKDSFTRLWAGLSSGDIYLSENQGETWTLKFSGSNQVNVFAKAPNGDIYAGCNGGTLLHEKGNSGLFASRPSAHASDNITALDVGDGVLWIGQGTKAYYTTNTEPSATTQWTQKKDFGANHSVRNIHLKANNGIGSDGQCVHFMVNDSSANEGDMWLTADGATFQEIDNLANSGYNDAHFSKVDDSKALICGEAHSSLALVHALTVFSGI